jgi:hypothetical protein
MAGGFRSDFVVPVATFDRHSGRSRRDAMFRPSTLSLTHGRSSPGSTSRPRRWWWGGEGKFKWYTHGGTVANVRLAWRLGQMLDQKTGCDEHAISFAVGVKIGEAKAAIEQVKADQLPFDPAAFGPLDEQLTFHDRLPEPRIAELLQVG